MFINYQPIPVDFLGRLSINSEANASEFLKNHDKYVSLVLSFIICIGRIEQPCILWNDYSTDEYVYSQKQKTRPFVCNCQNITLSRGQIINKL